MRRRSGAGFFIGWLGVAGSDETGGGSLRILFLVHSTSRVRHFSPVIRLLAERGHSIRIAALPKEGGLGLPDELDQQPGVSTTECPADRADRWRSFVGSLRLARDCARYLDPRFAESHRLRRKVSDREREGGILGFAPFCKRYPWIARHWRVLCRAFRLAEELVPSDRAFEAFLRSERPEVVLVTPLISYGSYQTDYVKSAHRLGLPIAFLPFSWDNLSTRGLVRIEPDRVLAWNEIQRREAVELHGVSPDRVVLTGAPRFDHFFALQPSLDRQQFTAAVGLDPAKPLILYLCSSPFVFQREFDFVRRWVHEIRQSSDPLLRECGVLVRPHPAHLEQWRGVDLSDLSGVALWRARVTKNGDRGLYDSLYHADTVVGLNTSAQIEAGILGKSVHTILVPEFQGGQQGTLHFDYLLEANGGLVVVARDFDEHRAQLAAALRPDPVRRERTAGFIERFVRPRGLERPAAPIMVEEIERLAELPKQPRTWAPIWHYPLRWALLRWLESRQKAVSSASGRQGLKVTPG